MKINKIFISNSTDPFFNLSYENFLLRNSLEEDFILFIWQSKKAVILGKYQNIYHKELFKLNKFILRLEYIR